MSAFRRRRVAVLLLVLVACAGCATSGGGALGAADFAKIVPGKTSKDEVRALLGAPARAHQLRNEPGETWEYPYYGNYERRTFWVEFSAGGTVRKTDDTPDFYAGKYKAW